MRPLALVLSLVATLVAACVSSPSPSAIALATQMPDEVCMQAITVGRLVLDPVSGLGLASGDAIAHLRWPSGWTARHDGDSIALIDPAGTIVARVGDTVTMGGGGGSGTWDVCPPVRVAVPPGT